ncbi:MAG: SDR family NAD(P)-dependent oxidoreductase [Alphaproteobacteria bacterium]|nr:SDR family NAD(P)-dependent oxidoreductase [Alphaproteobacteria bacterium]
MIRTALIVGAGSGLSAALARVFSASGLMVALAARSPDKLEGLAEAIGARAYACDAGDPASVAALFRRLDSDLPPLDLAVFNPSRRVRGPVQELDPADVAEALRIGAFGGLLMAREAVQRMAPRGHGTLLFTGASASVKGYAQSSPFAMAKFALRGLAQSLARELSPQGIHVGHVVIDGRIRAMGASDPGDDTLDPMAVAETYLALYRQPRSAWTWEVEVRPWVERF